MGDGSWFKGNIPVQRQIGKDLEGSVNRVSKGRGPVWDGGIQKPCSEWVRSERVEEEEVSRDYIRDPEAERWDWEAGSGIAYANGGFPLALSNIPGPSQLSKLYKEWIGHLCSKSLLVPGNEYFWCLRGAWRIEQNPRKVSFPSAAHIPAARPPLWKRGINEMQIVQGLAFYYSFFLEMSEVV